MAKASTKPQTPERYGLKDSLTLIQIRQLLEARGVTIEALAQALGQHPRTTSNWLTGVTEPTVATMEATLRLLHVVPVFVSVEDATVGASLRDYLDPEEQAIFDGLPSEPREVLSNQLRDLQLQRIRLENDYGQGVVGDREYRTILFDLMECIRRITDSLAKLNLSSEYTGQPAAVEWVHGSPRGPGYKEEEVTRVRKAIAEDEAKPKPKKEEPVVIEVEAKQVP